MLLCPLKYERHCASRKLPTDDFERLNVKKCFEFSLERMKMRWNMVSEVHLDQYPVKPTNRRHFYLFLILHKQRCLCQFNFESLV